jgi:hypothetical protein
LALSQFGTANPPLGQTTPNGFVFSIMGEFGHEFAFRGKSQELFRWSHSGDLSPELGIGRSQSQNVERNRKFLGGVHFFGDPAYRENRRKKVRLQQLIVSENPAFMRHKFC